MTDWDREVDVAVLGSGAAGLTAALTSAVEGAAVEVFEKAATVGGTSAVSGGVVWIPAHDRLPGRELTVADAMRYLRAQSLGAMDDALVETFVRTGPAMLDFLEAHTGLRFHVAEGFPDYKPELRAASRRADARSPLRPTTLGSSASGVIGLRRSRGFQQRGHRRRDPRPHSRVPRRPTRELCVAGTALVAGLLKGLLDKGVAIHTRARAVELIADAPGITGVRIAFPDATRQVRARRGVILACGGFEWDRFLVGAFLRGPMHGPVSPPYNTGDGLRMAMAQGADLANMGEAWWVPIVQIPGDTFDGHPRSRSVRLERTRPRSIIVNRAGRRFVNEAGEYNSMAGAFHYLDPRGAMSTIRRGSCSTQCI
ncbi:FAD binding domain protein [Mycobacterium xenopi 3993]|nr:FAD binding domain protein [Mycobacterium xenopi 3993]